MSWRPIYGILIFGLTLANFLLVPFIEKATVNKKLILGITVAVNLVVLGIFKYAYFTMDAVKTGLGFAGIDWKEPHLHIILPLGISFFVFEFIHYAVEVYRGKPVVKNFLDFALFPSFFPTQIAGPIKRYQDFVPQLHIPVKFKWEYVDEGMQLILMGLAKKVLIADNLALVVQAGFAHPEQFFILRYVDDHLRFRLPNLLRFCWLHRHCQRLIALVRLQSADQLQPALHRLQRCRFLASLAHQPFHMAA